MSNRTSGIVIQKAATVMSKPIVVAPASVMPILGIV
jgi:hypothetical protein